MKEKKYMKSLIALNSALAAWKASRKRCLEIPVLAERAAWPAGALTICNVGMVMSRNGFYQIKS